MIYGPWPDGIVTDELVTASWLDKVSESFARAWRAGGDGSIQAGSGGNDPAYLPGFLRITRIPT